MLYISEKNLKGESDVLQIVFYHIISHLSLYFSIKNKNFSDFMPHFRKVPEFQAYDLKISRNPESGH